MTVGELIAKLQTMNPNLDCVLFDSEYGEDEPLNTVEVRYRRAPFNNDAERELVVRFED